MKRLFPIFIACLTITVQALGRSSIFDRFYFSDPITRKIDTSVGKYKRNFGRLNRVYGFVSSIMFFFHNAGKLGKTWKVKQSVTKMD